MPEIIHHPSFIIHRRRGIALLMVLLIVMAVTIISMGFVARMDTELACGNNTLLRMQMDQLAESGLEHARGLILHPQDVPADQDGYATYWKGEPDQQLILGSQDYYTVNVGRTDPNDYCTYNITCDAYRKLTNGEKTGRSRLAATLRLDPCIALGVGANTTLWSGVKVYGDAYCKNGRIDNGTIYGDVFAIGSTSTRTGQLISISPPTLPLDWWPPGPPGTVSYSNSQYDPILPSPILRHAGDLDITEKMTIKGMLLVDGNLTIRDNASASKIMAVKNLPALYVKGKLKIEAVNNLWIDGLVVVGGDVHVNSPASITIVGGLFVGGKLDSDGSGSTVTIIADPMRAAIVEGATGSQTSWSPAAGGFYKSIRRQ